MKRRFRMIGLFVSLLLTVPGWSQTPVPGALPVRPGVGGTAPPGIGPLAPQGTPAVAGGTLPAARPSSATAEPTGNMSADGAVPVGVERVPLRVTDLTLKRLGVGTDTPSWQLWHGPRLFRDFGPDEMAARAVFAALRDQRPTEWFSIGTPRPLVEYGLVNGLPPLMPARVLPGSPGLVTGPDGQLANSRTLSSDRPLMQGLGFQTIVPIDLKSVRVEEIRGVWVVRDDHNLLINCADQAAAAEQALRAIRRHGLNRLGIVGQRRPVFRCLFAAMDDAVDTLPEPIRRHHLQLQSEALNPVGLAVPGLGYVGLVYHFDPRTLTLRKRGGQWQIVTDDDVVLGSFGPAENSAAEALRLLQQAQITAVARYGSLTLLFRQQQVADRLPLYVQVRQFDPAGLRVVTTQGNRCYVADQGRHLCDCRDPTEGQTICRILQAFGCNLLGHLGPTPRQGLTFFARHP
ncbi:MAG: hypothetical protein NZ703_02075 [Gemmataceae bacterium]|nr:hypothetical protein [Gemmataceae bacterium]